MLRWLGIIFGTLRSTLRTHRELALENLALRQQVAVWKAGRRRPRLSCPAGRLKVALPEAAIAGLHTGDRLSVEFNLSSNPDVAALAGQSRNSRVGFAALLFAIFGLSAVASLSAAAIVARAELRTAQSSRAAQDTPETGASRLSA